MKFKKGDLVRYVVKGIFPTFSEDEFRSDSHLAAILELYPRESRALVWFYEKRKKMTVAQRFLELV